MSVDRAQDLYEILEISPNASQETIDRVFRHLAQRYHPDRAGVGQSDRFDQIVKAHDILRDPEKRAAYDARHFKNVDYQWSLVEEAVDTDTFERDRRIQERVLSVLYIQRKRDMRSPGFGVFEIERMTGCPQEMLEFHLWYLREKGWIMRTEDGKLAITGNGVDQTLAFHQNAGAQRRITRDTEDPDLP
jgi:curved DNA-binding protein CbpA